MPRRDLPHPILAESKLETLPARGASSISFTCVGPIPDMIEDAVAAVAQEHAHRKPHSRDVSLRWCPIILPPAVRGEAIANAAHHPRLLAQCAGEPP